MAILNYTTKIDFEKTISEITKILTQHGAHKITTDYDRIDKIPIAVTFCLDVSGNTVGFSLPANYDGVLRAMQKDKKVPRGQCTKEQALRVSWRIIKDWVAAQVAITEASLAEMAEVFLPYAITKNGTTLFKEMKSGGMLMLG